MKEENWSLSNLPPEGHPDVAEFMWNLFVMAKDEKIRLHLPETWAANYKLFRGNHWGQKKKKNTLSINLFFANVQRTVANITSRTPVAEAVDLDGTADGLDKRASARIRKWWKDTNQKAKLRTTTQKSEKYGITIEKSFWDDTTESPGVAVKDPHSFFPAPGYYEDIATDLPYCCDAYPEPCAGVEAMFGVEGVKPSDVYSLLGENREELRPVTAGTAFGATNHATNTTTGTVFPTSNQSANRDNRALVVEVWVWDHSKDKEDQPNYPGGIRLVTLTNEGKLLLDDKKNPNINFELKPEQYSQSFLFNRLPFYKVNSYEDTTSIWGFSAAEQVGDINVKIDEIISRLTNYVMRTMAGGILVIPPDSGITRNMLNNNPGLVLFPKTVQAAKGIRYVALPNLQATFFQAIDLLMSLYDRIYSIQDADRGNAPNGVIAAQAIVALQERNAVLIQHKINAIDYLVEQRGMCAMSQWQNHGHISEAIEVDGETQDFTGTDLAGRNFNYVVESGSTMVKTALQEQAQAESFYEKGVIDRQALLETANFPNWKAIIERVGEGQLGQALQILVKAGLPEEMAAQLQQELSQSQGGPGNAKQNPQPQPPQTEVAA